MPAPTAADLIFSSDQANHNFSKTLGELKRSTLSIHNRLQSVLSDAEFAQSVAEAYGRPLIANERCGSWYIDPKNKEGSAYFKSTDGHNGVWQFSSRRLNFQLLEIAGKKDGCIIVDSTRRGKSMPDALSKTIPIWCSVLNRFLFPTEPQYHDLYTPPQVVSQSEHAQISTLLPSFVKALKDLHIQPESIRKQISKPLRPIWVTPESHITAVSTVFEDYHPIICCTVSRRVTGGESSEGGYIQGAGDDTENWAHGLTPTIFWGNKQTLLSTSEADLPDVIKTLVHRQAVGGGLREGMTCVKPTSCLFITKIVETTAREEMTGADTITIVLKPEITDESTWLTSSNRLDVGVGPHKIGMKRLRNALPFIIDVVKRALDPENLRDQSTERNSSIGESKQEGSQEGESSGTDGNLRGKHEENLKLDTPPSQKTESQNFQAKAPTAQHKKHIIIACQTGTDLSIGVGLAIVCLFFDNEGELLSTNSAKQVMNKDFVHRRLTWFSTSLPHANPARATLQSVNSFLMDHRRNG